MSFPTRALLCEVGCVAFFLSSPVLAQSASSRVIVEASPPVDDYSQGRGPRPSFGPPSGEYEHERFYLRLNAGVASLRASYSSDLGKGIYRGLGPNYGAALGGVIGHNLILFGEAQLTVVSDPALALAGQSSSVEGYNLTLTNIGPGVAYYLDPLGLLFSGSLTLGWVGLRKQRGGFATDVTDVGVGTNLQFGKEWWVDGDFGFGVVGQVQASSMKMKDQDARMTVLTLSLLLSLTYN